MLSQTKTKPTMTAQPTLKARRYSRPRTLTRRLLHDEDFRKALAKRSLFWFAHIYFAKYITHSTARFQRETYASLEDEELHFIELLGFRGSTKSTICGLIFPIWALIAGRLKYGLLIGDTFPQARQYLYNLRTELETNEMLIADFGPFKPTDKEAAEEWQKTTFVVPGYNARFSAHSTGQNIRGLRHLEHRPDHVICDDIENLEGVRSKEQRDKTYNWLKSDVLGVGNERTRIILVGNLLHTDSVMNRCKREIETGKMKGKLLEFPILKGGRPLWPGKHKSLADVEAVRQRIGNEKAWRREFMLQIVPDDGQAVHEEWIRHYREVPKEFDLSAKGCGVDLAISKKDSADYTGMVRGQSGTLNGTPKIYIHPDVVNRHFSMHETVERCALIRSTDDGIEFFVESVGYQEAAIETMKRSWINVKGVRPIGDKRARLETIAGYIQDGTVEFPETGCEDLIMQLLGFGIEEHDDLVDAFVYLILGLLKSSVGSGSVVWI
jgi:predicted phage terminase large subunit-like protein